MRFWRGVEGSRPTRLANDGPAVLWPRCSAVNQLDLCLVGADRLDSPVIRLDHSRIRAVDRSVKDEFVMEAVEHIVVPRQGDSALCCEWGLEYGDVGVALCHRVVGVALIVTQTTIDPAPNANEVRGIAARRVLQCHAVGQLDVVNFSAHVVPGEQHDLASYGSRGMNAEIPDGDGGAVTDLDDALPIGVTRSSNSPDLFEM